MEESVWSWSPLFVLQPSLLSTSPPSPMLIWQYYCHSSVFWLDLLSKIVSSPLEVSLFLCYFAKHWLWSNLFSGDTIFLEMYIWIFPRIYLFHVSSLPLTQKRCSFFFLIWRLSTVLLFLFFFPITVDLQYSVNFCCTAKWLIYMCVCIYIYIYIYIYIFFLSHYPPSCSITMTRQSSLCYAEESHCLSSPNAIICIY